MVPGGHWSLEHWPRISSDVDVSIVCAVRAGDAMVAPTIGDAWRGCALRDDATTVVSYDYSRGEVAGPLDIDPGGVLCASRRRRPGILSSRAAGQASASRRKRPDIPLRE
jgi:hypothetical protein